MASRLTKPQVRRSEEHTSELQSRQYLVCRLLLEKKKIPRRTAGHSQKSADATAPHLSLHTPAHTAARHAALPLCRVLRLTPWIVFFFFLKEPAPPNIPPFPPPALLPP